VGWGRPCGWGVVFVNPVFLRSRVSMNASMSRVVFSWLM